MPASTASMRWSIALTRTLSSPNASPVSGAGTRRSVRPVRMMPRTVSASVRTGRSADAVSTAPPASPMRMMDTKSRSRTRRNCASTSSRRSVLRPTWKTVPSGKRSDATSSPSPPSPVESVAQPCSPLSGGVASLDKSKRRHASGMLRKMTSRSAPIVRTKNGPGAAPTRDARIPDRALRRRRARRRWRTARGCPGSSRDRSGGGRRPAGCR